MGNLDDLIKSLKATDSEIEDAYYNKTNMAELRANEYMQRYKDLEDEFENRTQLNGLDLSILMVAAALQCIRWALLSSEQYRFSSAAKSDKYVNDIARSDIVPATVEQLLLDHQVPYDAQRISPRFAMMYPDESIGLGGGYHRSKTLGHDPIAGILFGTANIVTNTVTLADITRGLPSYNVWAAQIDGKTNIIEIIESTGNILVDEPTIVGMAFLKHIIHMGTDMFTPLGLPLPFVNSLSPEMGKWLTGKQIDTYSVGRSALLAIVLNKFVAMFHRLFYNSDLYSKELYEVKTRKVLMYSNVVASLINVGYVGMTDDIKRLDIGGLLVTLWRVLTDTAKIQKIKEEFITGVLHDEYSRELENARHELEKLGFSVRI